MQQASTYQLAHRYHDGIVRAEVLASCRQLANQLVQGQLDGMQRDDARQDSTLDGVMVQHSGREHGGGSGRHRSPFWLPGWFGPGDIRAVRLSGARCVPDHSYASYANQPVPSFPTPAGPNAIRQLPGSTSVLGCENGAGGHHEVPACLSELLLPRSVALSKAVE